MADLKTDKRVAVMVADGLEEIEGLTVVDILFRAGVPCETLSIKPERDVTSSHQVHIVCDRSLYDEDVDLASYHLVVLPGGIPGTPNLAACEPLMAELSRRMEAGLPVAAICAAPTILAQAGLLAGRKATCYPSMQHLLTENDAQLTEGSVVVDGTLTTSCGMGTAIDFALSIVSQLVGQDEADRIAQGIVYRQA